jgi:hypothetical protein
MGMVESSFHGNCSTVRWDFDGLASVRHIHESLLLVPDLWSAPKHDTGAPAFWVCEHWSGTLRRWIYQVGGHHKLVLDLETVYATSFGL